MVVIMNGADNEIFEIKFCVKKYKFKQTEKLCRIINNQDEFEEGNNIIFIR